MQLPIIPIQFNSVRQPRCLALFRLGKTLMPVGLATLVLFALTVRKLSQHSQTHHSANETRLRRM